MLAPTTAPPTATTTTTTPTTQAPQQSSSFDLLFASSSWSSSSSSASSLALPIPTIAGVVGGGVAAIIIIAALIAWYLSLDRKYALSSHGSLAASTEPANAAAPTSRAPYDEAEMTTRDAAQDGFAQGRVIVAEDHVQEARMAASADVPAAQASDGPARGHQNRLELAGVVVEQDASQLPVRALQPLSAYGSGAYYTVADVCEAAPEEHTAFREMESPMPT